MVKERKGVKRKRVIMKKTVTLDVDTLQKFEEVRMAYLRERHQLPSLSAIVIKGIEAVWQETRKK